MPCLTQGLSTRLGQGARRGLHPSPGTIFMHIGAGSALMFVYSGEHSLLSLLSQLQLHCCLAATLKVKECSRGHRNPLLCSYKLKTCGGSFAGCLALLLGDPHPANGHCSRHALQEVALIHSEGILAGEMKHGPLALVDSTMRIVVVATKDTMYNKMESVIQQLLARRWAAVRCSHHLQCCSCFR